MAFRVGKPRDRRRAPEAGAAIKPAAISKSTATSQVIERLYKIADAKRVPLGELLEQALDALEKK